MRRHGKRDKPENGNDKKEIKKAEPLTDKMENPVRTLIYNGAFFRYRVTDEQYKELLEKGKLGENFKIKRRGLVSNPIISINVEFEGMKDVEVELKISGDSFRASKILAEAGVPEEVVDKVGKIEFALQAGEHELVDELVGLGDLDPGPALGGIEEAFTRKKDNNSK